MGDTRAASNGLRAPRSAAQQPHRLAQYLLPRLRHPFRKHAAQATMASDPRGLPGRTRIPDIADRAGRTGSVPGREATFQARWN
ncbi:hypothetical protein ACRAWF_36890 [Streptomyces sp. L7]